MRPCTRCSLNPRFSESIISSGKKLWRICQELSHPLIIAKQIDDLGGMPAVETKTVQTSEKATEMLQFDLDNETETIRNYRERVRQCEELAEYAIGEQIREILIDEQDHQIALATALGKSVPIQRKTA